MNELTIERTPTLIAAEINNIKGQARAMILTASIEIGRRLVEAKEIVPYGEWENWLAESVDYSKSTANNLMRIFQEYGTSHLMLAGGSQDLQALGDLTYTQAVALLGIPREERAQFVEEHDLSNMSTRDLQQAVKEKQELKRKLAQAAANLKESEKERREQQQLFEDKLKAAEQRATQTDEQLYGAKLTNEDLQKKISELRQQLSVTQAAGNDAEAATLREQLAEANRDLTTSADHIEALEAQLKAKPIEASATVEVIPPEVQQELEQLRAKASPAVLEFRSHFNMLTAAFRDLLRTLADIPEPDHDRYRGAVNKLIDKMGTQLDEAPV